MTLPWPSWPSWLLPQHQRPVPVIAHVESRPAATSRASIKPRTFAGEVDGEVAPLPSSPLLLLPQQAAAPPVPAVQRWSLPIDTSRAVTPPILPVAGPDAHATEPSPYRAHRPAPPRSSCAIVPGGRSGRVRSVEPLPQHCTAPSLRIAHVSRTPARTAV